MRLSILDILWLLVIVTVCTVIDVGVGHYGIGIAVVLTHFVTQMGWVRVWRPEEVERR